MNLLGKGIVKCRQLPKNKSLEIKLTRHSDYIIRAVKITAVENANEMLTIMEETANKTYLSNISAAELTDARLMVSNYDGIKEVPGQTTKKKKDTGTMIIDQTVTAGRLNVANLITLVKSDCEFSDPNMLAGIIHAAKVVVLGVRYTPVNISVADDATGTAIVNADCLETLTKKTRKVVSNLEGVVEIKTHRAGKAVFTFSYPGYENYVLKVNIKGKVLNSFVVRMKKLIS